MHTREALDYVLLSRTICHILRHAPERYGVTMHSQGWADIPEVLNGLRAIRPDWADLQAEDLIAVLDWVPMDHFEVSDGRVRALYGHSTPERIIWPVSEPPEILFHGTDRQAARSILKFGLLPMGRQNVLLTPSRRYARLARSRKLGKPYLIRVDARRAHAEGIQFYCAVEEVWLADQVPKEFLSVMRPGRKHTQRRISEASVHHAPP